MLSKEERDSLELDGRIYLCYDYLFAIREDRILATHGGNISLITDKAEIICTYESIMVPERPSRKDEEELEAERVYIDDMLIYVENNKQGLIGYDGEILLQASYSEVEFGEDGEIYVAP